VTDDSAADLLTEAGDLVDRLAQALPSAHSIQRNLNTAALAALFLTVAISGCGRTPDVAQVRLFDECEQQFAAAKEPEDFRRVAMRYQQLIDQGIDSGTVYYNQGNAWMRADEPARAIASYRLAQRFRPRAPYLEANLDSALRACGSGSASPYDPGLLGYLFFWQNTTSYPEKLMATTVCLASVLCVAFLGTFLQRPRLTRRSLMIGLPVLALVFTSTAWDWYRFEHKTYGVTVVAEAVARKGNSDTYEPAFTQPLSEGTQFTVLEERDNWILAELSQGQTGWLNQREVATW